MNKDFCIFILTHGRARNVITYDLLMKSGYSGPVFLVVDDKDKDLEQYKKKYSGLVVVFSKDEMRTECDLFDNQANDKIVTFARNACFKIAKKLGFKYFMQLDDDYTNFHYRYSEELIFRSKTIHNLDAVLQALLTFYKAVPALSIAISQGGDFMGGGAHFEKGMTLTRKAMNTFIYSTERPFRFMGRINEDTCTYVNLGSKGELFFTISLVCVEQYETQSNQGGLTDIYHDYGTYVKSFYTVICNPSSVKITSMGRMNRRIHHKIMWKNTVPLILSQRVKKGSDVKRNIATGKGGNATL